MIEYLEGAYLISTDKTKLEIEFIFAELKNTYWGKEISIEIIQKSIANSLVYGVYKNHVQIGYARVITDFCTFAYLSDVFITQPERGKGLSKWLIESILKHPELVSLRRFVLITLDAHSLYEKHGFKQLPFPERYMEKS